MRGLVVLTLGLAVASASAAARSSQQPAAPPVFGSSTGLVLVDFVVTDAKDRPVAGLTARDFVVKEDGQERAITSLVAFANGLSQPERSKSSAR